MGTAYLYFGTMAMLFWHLYVSIGCRTRRCACRLFWRCCCWQVTRSNIVVLFMLAETLEILLVASCICNFILTHTFLINPLSLTFIVAVQKECVEWTPVTVVSLLFCITCLPQLGFWSSLSPAVAPMSSFTSFIFWRISCGSQSGMLVPLGQVNTWQWSLPSLEMRDEREKHAGHCLHKHWRHVPCGAPFPSWILRPHYC